MSTAIIYLTFLIGIILVVKGGDYFVEASTCIAKVLRIPTFIIGATIVSIATTLPEVIVSVMAAAQGKPEMAIGNAVGSVIANTGLIMALALIFMAIEAKRVHYMNRGILLIASAVTLYLACGNGVLSGVGSFVLIGICIFYIIDNIKSAKKHREPEDNQEIDKRNIKKQCLMFIVGAAGIIVGSSFLVSSGSEIAIMFNVSERVIAVTMVAIGTSLPELVTTLTAIAKKEAGLSIGNIIGANIIDLTIILPLCSLVSGGPLPVAIQTINIDLPFALGLTLMAMIPLFVKEKGYTLQGILMFMGYIFYLFVAVA
ncbi:MAG: calcium/sodium antiporter [Clostridiales bacterium]|nr:calcium/sodium antiporter [Clostridiales bacterium]